MQSPSRPRQLAIWAVVLANALVYLAFAVGSGEKFLWPGDRGWLLTDWLFFAASLFCAVVVLLATILFGVKRSPLLGKIAAGTILTHALVGLALLSIGLFQSRLSASQHLSELVIVAAMLALAAANYRVLGAIRVADT